MVLFKTENLSFTYPSAKRKALDNVSIEVNRGELVLLMGKTGSGKSTLLRLLKSELAPAGDVDGNIINNSDSTGFVQQNPETSFVAEKVRGELAFALENRGMSSDKIAVKIGETASFFNLTYLLDSYVSAISGGEKATTAIAAAMIADSDALILDEPFSQLDAKSTQQIISLIRRLNEELGITVILSTHSCDGIVDLCDKAIFLENGRVIECAPPNIAVKNNSLLGFFSVYTALFDERPLSVKQAIPFATCLGEKAIEPTEKKNCTLEAKKISFAYGKRERDILSQLSFKAYSGSINAVIGANGSGKTTLLKVLSGIKKCYSGKVKTQGKTAYLPQDVRYLFTKDTVGEEISLDTAKRFRLDENMTQHPYDLSGGQMQKLALAILSEQSFDILLLDEPTRALDNFAKEELRTYLNLLKESGKTIVLVSHDLDFVADTADFVSFLSDGIITISDDRRVVLSSLDFYTSSVRRITQRFLSNAVSVEDLV